MQILGGYFSKQRVQQIYNPKKLSLALSRDRDLFIYFQCLLCSDKSPLAHNFYNVYSMTHYRKSLQTLNLEHMFSGIIEEAHTKNHIHLLVYCL